METQQTSGKLILCRHTESAWNALGIWTGITDIDLSEEGFKQAEQLGEIFKDLPVDVAYYSEQKRSLQTLQGILKATGKQNVTQIKSAAINERDYGDLTGKNKWEVQKEIGEEAFNGIRRGWDYPVPGGETLKDVHARALPFYQKEIVPQVLAGKNVLLVAHGNSLRALMKYIENIPEENIANVEMPLGTVIVYHIDQEGRTIDKEVHNIEVAPSQA